MIEIQRGAVRVTLKKLLKITTKFNGRQYKRHRKKWRHQYDVGGIASRRTTATKRDDEQNHWTDLHAETHHSDIGKAITPMQTYGGGSLYRT